MDMVTLEPKALDEEIGFILRNAGKYMIRQPGRKDILSVFAGLRPLACNPDDPESTREVSRRHKITLTGSGLLSIIGGKWTFYRRMAEETIDRAIRAGMLDKMPCVTRDLKLADNLEMQENQPLAVYGNQAAEVKRMILDHPESGKKLHPSFPYTHAEITWICRQEMPVMLEDIMARRIRALFLDAGASLELSVLVAEIMEREMGWDSIATEKQISEYRELAHNYLCSW
jgi:glycerol-3-phosphate dehydrogenase